MALRATAYGAVAGASAKGTRFHANRAKAAAVSKLSVAAGDQDLIFVELGNWLDQQHERVKLVELNDWQAFGY